MPRTNFASESESSQHSASEGALAERPFFVGFELTKVCGIRSRIAGAGPPLLLLHGHPQTHAMWHAVAEQLSREFTRRRQLIGERLAGIPTLQWTPTGGGFFAFARVAGCTDSTTLASRLLEEAHVVTIPGAAFGQSGEGCLRLSFGSVSGDDLIEGLDRLGDYFAAGG